MSFWYRLIELRKDSQGADPFQVSGQKKPDKKDVSFDTSNPFHTIPKDSTDNKDKLVGEAGTQSAQNPNAPTPGSAAQLPAPQVSEAKQGPPNVPGEVTPAAVVPAGQPDPGAAPVETPAPPTDHLKTNPFHNDQLEGLKAAYAGVEAGFQKLSDMYASITSAAQLQSPLFKAKTASLAEAIQAAADHVSKVVEMNMAQSHAHVLGQAPDRLAAGFVLPTNNGLQKSELTLALEKAEQAVADIMKAPAEPAKEEVGVNATAPSEVNGGVDNPLYTVDPAKLASAVVHHGFKMSAALKEGKPEVVLPHLERLKDIHEALVQYVNPYKPEVDMAAAVAKASSAVDALIKGSPNHGQDGKFSSEPGGGAGKLTTHATGSSVYNHSIDGIHVGTSYRAGNGWAGRHEATGKKFIAETQTGIKGQIASAHASHMKR